MPCNCGGSTARQNALKNQAAAAQPREPRVAPTQTPGYYAGPKKPKK
jgi:hypothetical protein